MPLTPAEEIELILLLEAEARTRDPFRGDEWQFLTTCCHTIDEASGLIRPFPSWPYLEYLTKRRRQTYLSPPIHAYEKSRRMMISWWMICLYLYDVLTMPNHANFIGSRKLESSCYFLGNERLFGVYERIPESVWPNKPRLVRGPKRGQGNESVHCPDTGSYIVAIASGADQLRQYTATNVFCDEVAFWEWWNDSWKAIRPCIEGGGHVDLVTTPDLAAEAEAIYYPREHR